MLSINDPRSFKLVLFDIILLLQLMCIAVVQIFLDLNCIKYVLMKFGGSKFTLSHSFIFLNTQLKFCSKPEMLGLPTIMIVSSSNKMVLKLIFKFSEFILVRLLKHGKKE
jgi:hypothetical protein